MATCMLYEASQSLEHYHQQRRGGTTHETGQAALDFICHRSVNSLTSSSKVASSCDLSQTSLAPGLAIVAYRSQIPTPTNTASARKTTNVLSIEFSWCIATPLESRTDRHFGSGSCSKEVKSTVRSKGRNILTYIVPLDESCDTLLRGK